MQNLKALLHISQCEFSRPAYESLIPLSAFCRQICLQWLCLSVAESSQRRVEGLHRKGHHRCCQCRHRRIWPCECSLCVFDAFYCKISKGHHMTDSSHIHSCEQPSTATVFCEFEVELIWIAGPPDGDWGPEALLEGWPACVVRFKYWWNPHRQNPGTAECWDNPLHRRIQGSRFTRSRFHLCLHNQFVQNLSWTDQL